MSERRTTINVVEVKGETRATINTDGPVSFTLSFQPQKFADPRVVELESVVASQREEIAAALISLADTSEALREAKKAARGRSRR